MTRSRFVVTALAFASLASATAPAAAQRQPARPAPAAAPPRSAPIRNVRYELRFDQAAAARRLVHVAMTFDVAGAAPVLLSFPAWTPGAYELSFFAAKVAGFEAAQSGASLRWDKADHDTYRIRPTAAGGVTVRFDFVADELDNARTWAAPDFLLVNGTNVFPYAEGQSLAFPATVTIVTEPDWLVATGMRSGGAPRTYREATYHDLVDMPLFIGRLDLDSMAYQGKWLRLASWPAGRLTGDARAAFWREYQAVIPPMGQVFNDTPWDSYTTLLLFDEEFGGGSALEHQNSHVGIYNPGFIGTPILANITAHEIFHAWNVKRLRPAEMVPYRYDGPQPTPLLWVSEGFTDYYADLAMVRSGLLTAEGFAEANTAHAASFQGGTPVALEDASLSTWIPMVDGTRYVYYDKGGVVGFLLDILIRDASDNRASLDGVMRALYDATYRRGRGFTTDEFFQTAERLAGRSFTEFRSRYVDGRDSLPWAEVLPLGGFRWTTTTIREPRLGIGTAGDSAGGGARVTAVAPDGAGAEAGLQTGDLLVRLGDIPLDTETAFERFRGRYARREGEVVPLVIRRGDQELTLQLRVRLVGRDESRITVDPTPSPKAARVRDGILRGVTGS